MEYNRRHSIYSIEENAELKDELDTFILVYWLMQKTVPEDMKWELGYSQLVDIMWAFAYKYYDDDAAMDAYDTIKDYLAAADVLTIFGEEDCE